MRLPEEPDLPPRIDIVPAIDVIFAILVFFIISSLFLTRSEGLPVNLPQAETTELQQTEQITVSLDRDGNLALDDRPTQLDELQDEVEALMETESNAVVVVNADEAIAHGRVIEVIDRLRQIPNVSLAIAAKSESGDEADN